MSPKRILFGILIISVCALSNLLFTAHSLDRDVDIGSQEASPQTNDRFSTALESQLSCEETPEPARAIGALQKTGIIERRSYLNLDSMNYFHVRQPLTVWGFKVVSVFGFAFNPRIFERGPGTAPPITLGVAVPVSETSVTSKLMSLGLEHVHVQRAAELKLNPKRVKSSVLTEISCEEREVLSVTLSRQALLANSQLLSRR